MPKSTENGLFLRNCPRLNQPNQTLKKDASELSGYALRDRIVGKNHITPAGSKIRGKRPHSAQKSKGSTDQWTDARNSTDQVMATDLRGVLVAISIPIFTVQLEKSREAVDLSNIRAAYAECSADVLTGDGKTGYYEKVDPKQTTAGWVSHPDMVAGQLDVTKDSVGGAIVSGTPVYVMVDKDGKLTLSKDASTSGYTDASTVGKTTNNP